jgi:translation initiation factor 5B
LQPVEILKRFKTPFVVAATKIDKVTGWNPQSGQPFIVSYPGQPEHTKVALDEKIYEIGRAHV